MDFRRNRAMFEPQIRVDDKEKGHSNRSFSLRRERSGVQNVESQHVSRVQATSTPPMDPEILSKSYGTVCTLEPVEVSLTCSKMQEVALSDKNPTMFVPEHVSASGNTDTVGKSSTYNERVELRACVLNSPNWEKLQSCVGRLQKRYPETTLNVDTETEEVLVIGTYDVKSRGACVEEVKEFIDLKCITEEFIEADVGKARYIVSSRGDIIRNVDHGGALTDQSISKCKRRSIPGILVTAPSVYVAELARMVESKIENILTDEQILDEPGVADLLPVHNGINPLRHIQRKFKCIIEATESSVGGKDNPGNQEMRRTASFLNPPTVKWSCSIKGDFEVKVRHGDITEVPVDAMVNVTDQNLSYDIGVAKAIVEAGGRDIGQEIGAIVKFNGGKLREGHVAATCSGSLQCKRVVHVVGPLWSKDERCIELLRKTIKKILKKADTHRCKSLAMPMIRARAACFPMDRCADVMIERVVSYFKKHNPTYLKEVCLVDVSYPACQAFYNALVSHRGHHRVVCHRNRVLKQGHSADAAQVAISRQRHTTGKRMSRISYSGLEIPAPRRNANRTVTVKIHAESQSVIENAKEELDNFIKDNIFTMPLQCSEVTRKPTKEEMEEIQKIFADMEVKVTRINQNEGFILQLQGLHRNVLEAAKKLGSILRNFEKQEREIQRKIDQARDVTWLYWAEEEFVNYDELLNATIEDAYVRELPEVHFCLGQFHYKIIFRERIEINSTTGVKVHIRRETSEGICLPRTWVNMESDEFECVEVSTGTKEYEKVCYEFIESVGNAEILKVERIQNPALYKLYVVQRDSVAEKRKDQGSDFPVERSLYHGTRQQYCDKINATGFNRSFAGRNAAVYGQGCYFAVNASLSASSTYAKPDDRGNRYVYRCSVITGLYTEGKSRMKEPPPIDKAKDETDLFDSLVNDIYNPSMYVVFQDARAYPDYLITFSFKHDSSEYPYCH